MIEFYFDAALDDGGDVFLDHLARQAEDGHADANLPAQVRLALEDRHVVPVAFQFPGGGQTGRSAADDRRLLARRAVIRRQRAEWFCSCRRPQFASDDKSAPAP